MTFRMCNSLVCHHFISVIIIVERNVLRLERRFGVIVKDTKNEILNDEQKIRELPDLIEYELPQRFKALGNFVTRTSLTRDNFDKLFEALERMWSFIDYDLLRTIILEYENIELMNKVDDYKEDVEKFCAETTIYEFIQAWKPRYNEQDIPQELRMCVTELSLDLETSTVKDLKKIQDKLRYSLPQELAMAAFFICNMRPGSLKVSWLVWAECVPDLMDSLKLLLQSKSEITSEIHLSFMSLDNVVLYSAYNDQVIVHVVNYNRFLLL